MYEKHPQQQFNLALSLDNPRKLAGQYREERVLKL